MVKNGITHAHLGPIWYNSEPSEVPYSLVCCPGLFLPLLTSILLYKRLIAIKSESKQTIAKIIGFKKIEPNTEGGASSMLRWGMKR
jgi:hypothetical protein